MNFKAKKALVTGSTGFVGANLTRHLVKNGFEVHVIVRKKSNLWRIDDIKKKIHIHYVNLNQSKELKKLLEKIDPNFIFHLAAYGAYSWQSELKKMIKTNLEGTMNLLDASLDIDYECFVNAGSSSEYGFKKSPMKEDMALDPNSYYALTKASSTMLCKVYAKKFKKPIVTLRLFSVYGPYEDRNRLVPTAIMCSILKKSLDVTSGGEMRDFIYIDDVIMAFLAAIELNTLEGQVYNIGTGRQYTNVDVGKTVSDISNGGLDMKVGKYTRRDWDTNYWVADISKSKKYLGWKPKYSLKSGLELTYKWFVDNLALYS